MAPSYCGCHPACRRRAIGVRLVDRVGREGGSSQGKAGAGIGPRGCRQGTRRRESDAIG
jgi:hypothetical protein